LVHGAKELRGGYDVVSEARKPKRKPKFKVGQVVKYKFDGSYVQIGTKFDSEGNCYINGHHKDTWAWIGELRPLTKREIGPR
jgi:hypothetical protein